jgi:hypothetical protein
MITAVMIYLLVEVTMDKYIWLFPVLFIFHDMEEIIGFGIWIKKNKEMLEKKFPRISKIYNNFSTEGMSVAVFEELLLCIFICIISILTNWYALWLGTFIAYAVHLFLHLGQSIVIRKYIPALATSIIALPISIWLISDCIKVLDYSFSFIVMYSIIGIVVVVLNLKFAHMLMHKFSEWISSQKDSAK